MSLEPIIEDIRQSFEQWSTTIKQKRLAFRPNQPVNEIYDTLQRINGRPVYGYRRTLGNVPNDAVQVFQLPNAVKQQVDLSSGVWVNTSNSFMHTSQGDGTVLPIPRAFINSLSTFSWWISSIQSAGHLLTDTSIQIAVNNGDVIVRSSSDLSMYTLVFELNFFKLGD